MTTHIKKSAGYIAASFAAMFAVSCHNAGKSSVQNADSANSSKIDSGSVTLTGDETKFMVTVANDGMTEIQMGQLVQKTTHNARIQRFATMLVNDHTQAGNELKALAGSKNVTLPDSLSQDSKSDMNALSKKKGTSFDKQYLSDMVRAHEKAVSAFQNELNDVKNPDLRQWITTTLPTLQTHLDSARVLDSVFNHTAGKPYPATP